MSLASGSSLGPYMITAELGHGGMGVVYMAQDPRLKRQVAIKLLTADLTRDETAKQRFLQEAQAASALDHPNICTIYEINETDDGQLYLVMAYYEGETLKERIERGALALDEAVDIATQVGLGLAEAHSAGIVHRDIKPANLLIATSGVVKILDFGLAKLMGSESITGSAATLGTVAYMSPEQARGQEVDHRTDVWSLGVVLYEMLTGQQPFRGDNLLALADAIRNTDPTPLAGDVSSVSGAVTRSLSKDARKRYQAVADFLGDLTAAKPPTGPTASRSDVPSVAVLPFTDMSPQRDQEYFCEGIAEEIINALTGGDALRVAARISSFQAKAKGLDIADVGARLKVDTVLQGSLRKAGDQLRITARLVKVSDGYQMWSERFDRPMNDVFTVQDEIARAIATRLSVSLIPQAGGTMLAPPTSNLDAYNAFLMGRFLMAKGKHPEAADQFEQALQLDPQYAAAHADLAEATAYMGDLGFIEPRAAAVRARKAAERALELDPRLTQAVVTLAWIAMGSDWDWASAERHFTRALALDPRLGDAHARYGFFLSVCGRFDDAVAQVERAVELDPMNYMMHHWRGVVPCLGGRPDDAVSRLRQALDLEPDNWLARMFLGMALRLASRPQEALDAGRRAVKDGGRHPWAVAELGITHTAAGETAQAVALQDELTARSHSEHGAPIHHAALCVALGKLDRAFELLDRAYDTRDVWCIFLNTNPDFDAVRSDLSFQALLRRMNFPETANS